MPAEPVDPKKLKLGPEFVPVVFAPDSSMSNPIYTNGRRVIGLLATAEATAALYEVNVYGPEDTFYKGASVEVGTAPRIYPLPPADNLHLFGAVAVYGASAGLYLMLEKVL